MRRVARWIRAFGESRCFRILTVISLILAFLPMAVGTGESEAERAFAYEEKVAPASTGGIVAVPLVHTITTSQDTPITGIEEDTAEDEMLEEVFAFVQMVLSESLETDPDTDMSATMWCALTDLIVATLTTATARLSKQSSSRKESLQDTQQTTRLTSIRLGMPTRCLTTETQNGMEKRVLAELSLRSIRFSTDMGGATISELNLEITTGNTTGDLNHKTKVEE